MAAHNAKAAAISAGYVAKGRAADAQTCGVPSGDVRPGQMVSEFGSVVFKGELGKVHGPVNTQLGYHLIDITMRS